MTMPRNQEEALSKSSHKVSPEASVPPERGVCKEHSGVKAEYAGIKGQQTLVVWLLGILIALMITVVGLVGMQSLSIASIDKQVTVIPVQLQFLAEGQKSLTENMGLLDQRVRSLEDLTGGIATKQGNFIDADKVAKKAAAKAGKTQKTERSWWGK